MKNQKFDPKAFLDVTELSPLESQEVKGGAADVRERVRIKGDKTKIRIRVR